MLLIALAMMQNVLGQWKRPPAEAGLL